ncbi:UPF0716 protein FxsA [Alkalihalobacillus xiaoxiensis]|uniref:UPF0716 protein FxsA n=1 Tax=Shouchella xiaoxiensis TaxID=766895 RepID=A0ABS2SUI3_9BACI|nr:FxsA family protein [Shouchella xiaoxiensis]MBM7838470.1 UPF0716 protein FxsA [Shouchella xiaoxiensis]
MKKFILPIAIGLPLLELFVIILFVNWIGVWSTLGLMLLTSVIGVLFAKSQGLKTIKLAQVQMQNNQVPNQSLLDSICIFIGGALLVLPGFIMDVIGLFLLIPWTRTIVKAGLLKGIHSAIAKGQFVVLRRR